MAKNVTSDYKTDSKYIKLMQEAARLADFEPYKNASRLYASDKYVATLKYLYLCAEYLRGGKSINDALLKAYNDVGFTNRDNEMQLKNQVKNLLNTNILDGVSETNATARYYKVMGFAIHLTGDTFAYRTIAPSYTVNGTNPVKKKVSTPEKY